MDPAEATRVRGRGAGLRGRAGGAGRADEVLGDAMELSPDDAHVAELRAAVAAWGASDETRERVVIHFLDAAARRGRAGAKDAQLENVLRAFSAAPASRAAGHALARALD